MTSTTEGQTLADRALYFSKERPNDECFTSQVLFEGLLQASFVTSRLILTLS